MAPSQEDIFKEYYKKLSVNYKPWREHSVDDLRAVCEADIASQMVDADVAAVRVSVFPRVNVWQTTCPVQVTQTQIQGPTGTLPLRLFTPPGDGPFPILFYIHGGGWVVRDQDYAPGIALVCNAAVVAPEYRLAPEHPFPAAVDDSWAALQWLVEHADNVLEGVKTDPGRIAIIGESAGGNLTAVLTNMAAEAGMGEIKASVPVCMTADAVSLETGSYAEFEHDLVNNKLDMAWLYDQYLPKMADRNDPRASPLLAQIPANHPPTLIVTADVDVLRDEGEAYAQKLMAAGVKARTMRCGPYFFHDGMLDIVVCRDHARAVLKNIKSFLDEAFAGNL